MAGLSYSEKSILEELFDMKTGYVMDFSNNTFRTFVGDAIGLDIYSDPGYEEYASKANKLRQIWGEEPDNRVGILLHELLNHCEDWKLKENKLTEYDKKKIREMLSVATRLQGKEMSVSLPQKQEETLSTLLDDIKSALSRNMPELVLDRLHTYATKLLRQICMDNAIMIKDSKGDYFPLHSLAGMLKRKYEQDNLFQSSFTLKAIQNSISLFDEYNAVRNNQSYAHDNEILDKMEAEFAVRIMADLVTFIDKAETYRKRELLRRQKQDEDIDLPF